MSGEDDDPFDSAAAAHAEGRLDAAAAGYARCLERDPGDAVAMALLGAVRTLQGRAEEGRSLLGCAVELDPANEVAWLQLGIARRQLGDLEGCVDAIDHARALRKPFPETVAPLTGALAILRRFARIADLAAELAATDVGFRETQLAAIDADLDTGRHDDAECRCRRLLEVDPRDPEVLARLVRRSLVEPSHEAILTRLRVLRAEHPGSLLVLSMLGEQCARFGRLEEAAQCWQEVAAADPADLSGRYEQARVLAVLGRIDESTRRLEEVLSSQPDHPDAWLMLSQVKRFTRGDPMLVRLEQVEADLPAQPEQARCHLHFAVANVRDGLGEHDRAFEHLTRGSDLHRALQPSDIGDYIALTRAIVESAPPDWWRALHRPAAPGGPILVVGMPRSGTTLTERILARHPAVRGAGELSLATLVVNRVGMSRILHEIRRSDLGAVPPSIREVAEGYLAGLAAIRAEGRRICDKQPQNYRLLGPLALGMPDASIVHCVRDPRDIAVSFFQAYLIEQPWSFDLRDIGRCIRSHDELMRHWHECLPGRIVTVRYERLVTRPEEEIPRLLGELGLAFDERCLRPEEDAGAVTTASLAQVRRRINADSIGRWRRHERHLAPLLDEIADLLRNEGEPDHSSSRT